MDVEAEPRRRFFRLRDLVVICLILVLLVALLMPSVRSAGEASRRSQCSNKLKQIGLALQNHHDLFKRFPALTSQSNPDGSANVWATAPGATFAPDSPAPNGYTQSPASAAGYSWIVKILPYMEEQGLYDTISKASFGFTREAFSSATPDGTSGNGFTVSVAGVARHFSAVPLDEVSCPSFSGSDVSTASLGTAKPPCDIPAYRLLGNDNVDRPIGVTITNYVALSATHLACMAADPSLIQPADPDVEPPNGVIVPGEGLNMKQILDGTSKTLIVCETKEPAVNSWYDGTVCWTVGANPNASHQPTHNQYGYWNFPTGTTNASSLNYGPDPDPERLFAPHGTTAAQTQIVSWGPSSDHSGGVVTHLAADGSVHSLTSDIDPTLYIQLITRAGREPSGCGADESQTP